MFRCLIVVDLVHKISIVRTAHETILAASVIVAENCDVISRSQLVNESRCSILDLSTFIVEVGKPARTELQ